MLDGFEAQKSVKKAQIFIKEILNIDADYRRIDINVANDMNQELIRAFNMFGTVGLIDNIKTSKDLDLRGAFGSYDRMTRTIFIRPKYGRLSATMYIKNASDGLFSTRSPYHGYRHEIGHALLHYIETSLLTKDRIKLVEDLKKIYSDFFVLSLKGLSELSGYSRFGYSEMVAEAIAQVMNNSSSKLAMVIIETIRWKNVLLRCNRKIDENM